MMDIMKRKLPQFEPAPHLWNRIEGRLSQLVDDRMPPLMGWTLTVAVVALLVLSCVQPLGSAQEETNLYPTHNTLYHE